MKKLLFIVNPMAGRGAYKNNFGEAVLKFHEGGYIPTVRFTSGPRDAADIAAQEGADAQLVCCLGGDGTLSEVMEGLVQLPREQRPPLGYIPLGTANDVATTLDLPKNNLLAAVDQILSGQPMDWDLGEFDNVGSFTYVAAFGAFTDVSYETPQREKQALGHLAYVLEGVTRLPKLTSYPARVVWDGGETEDEFWLGGVTNSTSVAGMIRLKSEQICFNDGLFELVLVRKPRNLTELRQTTAALRDQTYDSPCLRIIPTAQATFTFTEPVAWTRDGEDGGVFQEITLRNIHNAIQIIV